MKHSRLHLSDEEDSSLDEFQALSEKSSLLENRRGGVPSMSAFEDSQQGGEASMPVLENNQHLGDSLQFFSIFVEISKDLLKEGWVDDERPLAALFIKLQQTCRTLRDLLDINRFDTPLLYTPKYVLGSSLREINGLDHLNYKVRIKKEYLQKSITELTAARKGCLFMREPLSAPPEDADHYAYEAILSLIHRGLQISGCFTVLMLAIFDDLPLRKEFDRIFTLGSDESNEVDKVKYFVTLLIVGALWVFVALKIVPPLLRETVIDRPLLTFFLHKDKRDLAALRGYSQSEIVGLMSDCRELKNEGQAIENTIEARAAYRASVATLFRRVKSIEPRIMVEDIEAQQAPHAN